MALKQINVDVERVTKPTRKRSKITRIPKPKKEEARPETTYRKASDVSIVANELIDKSGYQHLHALRQAKIAYIFTSADHIRGCDETTAVTRFPKKLEAIAGPFDFVMLVSAPKWERLDREQQRASVYHALRHCDIDEKGRWRIEDHDFAGFVSELQHFGLWTERLSRPKQLGLFDKA